MKRTELVTAVAEKTGVSEAEVDCVLKTVLDTITCTLAHGDEVTLPGFGSFKTSKHAARDARNPQTGAVVHVAACVAPTFHAGKALKDAVNK
ncbi:MAG: HU family DNA-binding protein [Coprobacillus sp.]|nr:HU family DNA-binding protein [Coprobacillus sp.]